MAVYTQISAAQLDNLLNGYGLRLRGEPRGVAAGVENSTYFFTAVDGAEQAQPLVLTIVERCSLPQLEFSCALATHLHCAGLPVPSPLPGKDGMLWCEIAGKRALIVPRVDGVHPEQPGEEECRQMGNYLARAHLAASTLPIELANRRGLSWLENACRDLSGQLVEEDKALLTGEIGRLHYLRQHAQLPSGPIHGDLFRDNSLFQDGSLTGVIDFLFACRDWWLLDLAIVANDWCTAAHRVEFNAPLLAALLDAYQQVRPLCAAERQYWADLLCVAATRFWVSRLLALHGQQASETIAKKPEEYRTLLLDRRTSCSPRLEK